MKESINNATDKDLLERIMSFSYTIEERRRAYIELLSKRKIKVSFFAYILKEKSELIDYNIMLSTIKSNPLTVRAFERRRNLESIDLLFVLFDVLHKESFPLSVYRSFIQLVHMYIDSIVKNNRFPQLAEIVQRVCSMYCSYELISDMHFLVLQLYAYKKHLLKFYNSTVPYYMKQYEKITKEFHALTTRYILSDKINKMLNRRSKGDINTRIERLITMCKIHGIESPEISEKLTVLKVLYSL